MLDPQHFTSCLALISAIKNLQHFATVVTHKHGVREPKSRKCYISHCNVVFTTSDVSTLISRMEFTSTAFLWKAKICYLLEPLGLGQICNAIKPYARCTLGLYFSPGALSQLWLDWYHLMITSRAARGGGGSFKNRKRIGEIDCCEWWMSEQKHWPTD